MTTGGDKATYLFGIPYQDLPKYAVKEPIGNTPVEYHDGINYELLDEIMEFIKTHPRSWQQQSWYMTLDPETGNPKYFSDVEEMSEVNSCGAAFCFAGHVAIHEGFPAPPVDGTDWDRKVIDSIGGYDGSYYEEVYDFAEKVLGITSRQADALFDGNNSIEHLETTIAILKKDPDVDGDSIREIRSLVLEENQSLDEAYEEVIG